MRPICRILCPVLCLALPLGACSAVDRVTSVFGYRTSVPEAPAPQPSAPQTPVAQAAAPPPSSPPPVQNAMLRPSLQNDMPGPVAQGDVLKPGDGLHITVAGEEELSGAFAVNGDGTIRMELLGAVQVAGLSLTTVQEQLRQRLAAGYLKNPQVRVERSTKLAVTPPTLRPSLSPTLRPSLSSY